MKLLNKNKSGRIGLLLAVLAVVMLMAAMPTVAAAKSLYLAANHHTAAFDAWSLNPDGTVTYQATYTLQYATDPAGVAIDADSETIFITSEFSPGVEMVDPVSLTYLGVSTGPSDLAGIDIDDVNDIVYTAQRMTPNLYIYQWDEVAKTITEIDHFALPNSQGIMGVALDEWRQTLWVADSGSGIYAYDYDYYEITGLGTTPVDIEVVSASPGWYTMLLDASGNYTEIAVDPTYGYSYPAKHTGAVPDGGVVRFMVGDVDADYNPYQIAVWPTGSAAPTTPQVSESEPNDSFASPNVFASTGDLVINGEIGTAPTGDWHSMVRAYDTNTWTEDTSRSFTPSHVPVGLAVDRVRNCVYSVSIDGGATVPPGTGSWLLSKWDVATGTETTIDMGHGGVGVAVDEVTGYVYVTGGANTGDQIEVWDTSTTPFTEVQDTGPIGNPAGLVIGNASYNPLTLVKNDLIQGEGISVGMTFTYEITFDSPLFDLTGVTVVDTLPAELDFVSATDGGVYDPATHTVVWNLGSIAAGAAVPTLHLDVLVNASAQVGSTVYNYATIDSDQTPPTTVIDDETDGDPGIIVEPPEGNQVFSCDSAGNPREQFAVGESVYVKGTGLEPNTTYAIWIQDDPVAEGDALVLGEDQSGAQELVTTDANGDFGPLEIWAIPADSPLTCRNYDIVADKQDDGENTGEFNSASDGIDAMATVGFVAPIPELSPLVLLGGGLLLLGGCFVLRKRRVAAA